MEEVLVRNAYAGRKVMNQQCNHFIRSAVLSTAICAFAGAAHAGFQYTPRDLVFGFRTDGGGTPEVTINAGQVSTFYNLPVGQTMTVANVNATILSYAFPDLNNLLWSCAADVRTNGDVTYPIQTLWVISPRSDLNTQTSPWQRRSQFSQALAGAKIDGIAGNADLGGVAYGNQVPGGPTNTTTAIVIPDGLAPYAYSVYMGAGENYAGTFPGVVECPTGPTFTTDGQPVRADFYQLTPGSGDGTFLGYFEFSTSGVMTYHAGPSSSPTVPRPTITGVTRAGTTTSVSFTTVSGAQYSLRYTNSAGLTSPVSTWLVSGSPVPGTGTTVTITDTTSDALRFYSVSAH